MAKINTNYGSPRDFFLNPLNVAHKKYEVLRAFFVENKNAEVIAKEFGYKLNAVYDLTKKFGHHFRSMDLLELEKLFFTTVNSGRKRKDEDGNIKEIIISLRKKYLSVPEIKAVADTKQLNLSERYIRDVLKEEGFARLPRRTKKEKDNIVTYDKIKAPVSSKISFENETFNTENIGILCLFPYLKLYGIDQAISNSLYPGTKAIDKFASILSFLALKLSNIKRYSADDLWCMDRGTGLFATLNVLPKTSWYSSYSSRITRKMNVAFLKELHQIWKDNELLSDTVNLDFTTIPYWGNDSHLENNWSGKRHKALASMLAVLGQDPDSGIIDYGDTNIRHKNQSNVVFEFLDFYQRDKNDPLKYLIFDSKFTPYQNLKKLDKKGIKFITIRKRTKNIVDKLNKIPKDEWQSVRVMNADGKGRIVKIYEERVHIKDFEGELRQLAITGHGKIKPALIITNDNKVSKKEVVRKYSRRWIVEKGISEQIEFFHFNKVSSSMVIKVDFDFTMTILAHNLYRLLALNLPGYSHNTSEALYHKFICNSGYVEITQNEILVKMKKKRNLPAILSEMEKFKKTKYQWLGGKKLIFLGATTS